MKVRLLRDSRIVHKAGEIVEVSPAEAGFLISVKSAEEIAEPMAAEVPDEKPAEAPKKAAKKKK